MLKIAKFVVGTMGTNCYFLIDEATGKAAVTDPGAECGRLLGKLAERGLKCEKILLTHGHFDHILALEELREATGAPLYMHSADAELIADPEKSCARKFAGDATGCRPPEFTLADGDTVSVGGECLTVLHTPGHTPGSVCYDDGKRLFCGDLIFRGGGFGRYDLYGGDYGTLVASLTRVGSLGERTLYPGHGASTLLSEERALNPWLGGE